jgi:hypothetical protein
METRFPYDRESQHRIVADRMQERLAPAEAARRRHPCPDVETSDPAIVGTPAPEPVRRWWQIRPALRSDPCAEEF